MAKLALVIFDFDGTLVEFPRDYLFAETTRILSLMNHPPIAVDELWRHFSAFDFFGFVQDPAPEAFVERFWNHFDWPNYPRGIPFTMALETLRVVKELGYRTAIATARLDSPDVLLADLARCGLDPYIDAITTRTSPDTHWMDKRGHIQELCERFDVQPEQVMLVGDIPADITSARAAGVRWAVAVRSGGIRDEVLLKTNPDHLLDHIGDLAGLLRAIRSGSSEVGS